MRVKQVLVRDVSGLVNVDGLSEVSPQLVMAFGAPCFFNAQIAAQLRQQFPKAVIIGCSTAGEIAQTAVHENTLVVTAIHFDNPGFIAESGDISDMADSEDAGRRLANKLKRDGLHTVLVYAPGVDINGSAMIRGMASALPANVRITGGLAGDNGAFKQTFTMLDGVVSDRQLVAIGIHDPKIAVGHGSFGGWQPFGPVRKVTKCSGNKLFELDGEPALGVYKKYLGEYAAQLPSSGLLFPFEMLASDRSQTGLIRTPLAIDETEGSLTLAGEIDANGYLRLMHANTDGLIDGAQESAKLAASSWRSNGETFAILISCVGRRLVMGSRVDEEVEAVSSVFGPSCGLTGFYSYGEVSPFHGTTDCKLHNQTMTVTCLTEK